MVTIVYDGDGNRASETVGGATTKYLVDTLNPTGLPQVLDETVNGAVTRTYAYGLQRISENQLNGSTWTAGYVSQRYRERNHSCHWHTRVVIIPR